MTSPETLNIKIVVNELSFPLATHMVHSDTWFGWRWSDFEQIGDWNEILALGAQDGWTWWGFSADFAISFQQYPRWAVRVGFFPWVEYKKVGQLSHLSIG
jgi:hypothetical protein